MGETCHLNLFKHCVTIASTCNHSVTKKFLEEKTIGLIPSSGYQRARKYSLIALHWLAWIHHQTGDRILYALNSGEQKIDCNYVDGYNPRKRIIYEFHGGVSGMGVPKA